MQLSFDTNLSVITTSLSSKCHKTQDSALSLILICLHVFKFSWTQFECNICIRNELNMDFNFHQYHYYDKYIYIVTVYIWDIVRLLVFLWGAYCRSVCPF